MADRQSTQRSSFIISIWTQGDAVWRGYVESTNGSRHYFASLEQLSSLLAAYGWQEQLPIIAPNLLHPTDKQEHDS